MKQQSIKDLLHGELISNEVIDLIFTNLGNQILDQKEVIVDLKDVTFISVYFLERLELFLEKVKELNAIIKIINVQPTIYKVFRVSKVKAVLDTIC